MLLGATSSTSSCCRGCGQLDNSHPTCIPVGQCMCYHLSAMSSEVWWPVLTTAHIWMLGPAHPSAGSDSRALSRQIAGQPSPLSPPAGAGPLLPERPGPHGRAAVFIGDVAPEAAALEHPLSDSSACLPPTTQCFCSGLGCQQRYGGVGNEPTGVHD